MDKQSTELRNAGAFAERNGLGKTAETRMDIGSPTRARTWDLRINSPSLYQLSYRGIWDKKRELRAGFYPSPPTG